ncbi:MAG: hypothetical protein KGV58_01400 [Campylobacteraceae bacterium]|nr:hypothetical protein [Campylobacteraceae bacterium]
MEEKYFFIFLVCACALVFVIVNYLFRPKYKDFKEIELHGVIWKWQWHNKKICALSAYCPTCKSELIFDDESAKIFATPLNSKFTFFICANCNEEEKGRIQGGDRKHALKIVKNEIYKLVNTKKFKEILDERKRI